MRECLFTAAATDGEHGGRFGRGNGHGELELEMTLRTCCLDMRMYWTRVDDLACRVHLAVSVFS